MHLTDFFNMLYPDFDNRDNLVDIRPFYIHSGYPQSRRYCKTISEIIEHVTFAESKRVYNVYFQCAELSPQAEIDRKSKEAYCVRYNFLYSDIDADEKDENGRVIKTYSKEELIERIKQCPLSPSIIVDSGRGYHAYWLLQEPITNQSLMQRFLNRLQELLAGDSRAKLLTQLLRPPTTTNRKKDENKQIISRPVRLVQVAKTRYSLAELVETLGVDPNEPAAEPTLKTKKQHALEQKSSYRNPHTTLSFDFTKPLPPLNIEVESCQDLIDIIKRQNIFSVTNQPHHELSKPFLCLFHHDKNPSANIYLDKRGYYMYKCFGCDRHMDIIQIYRNLAPGGNKSFLDAILDLAQIFGIKTHIAEWVSEQRKKYHYNAMFLEEFERYGYDTLYPNFYKLIRSRLKYISVISQYGLSKLVNEDFVYEGQNLFFFSYEYLAKKYSLSITTLKTYVTFYAILGLIKKVDVKELPPHIAKRAYDMSDYHQKTNNAPRELINFYILPNFFDVIDTAEERAKKLLENNFRFKTCLNKTFLILHFGQAFADEIFPDDRTLTEKSQAIAKRLEQTLLKLIKEQGYATKQQVISKTKLSGRIYANVARKKRELERNLANFLADNKLIEKTANKNDKERLGLRSYIKIIVPIED